MASNFPNPEEINEDTGALWESGDTWTDSESGYTYIYSPANGQSRWRMQSGTYTTPNLQSVTDAGNNTTNNITLGTNKITLNATDGGATFANSRFNIDSDGGTAVVYQGADDATPCLDLYVPNGATTTPYIRATNGLTEVASINADGSAEFAGGNITFDSNGAVNFAGQAVSSMLIANHQPPDETIQRITVLNAYNSFLGYSKRFSYFAWEHDTSLEEFTPVTTSWIDHGGSAFFAGDVTTSGVVFGTPSGVVRSKTLDDYEEGSFTPDLGYGGLSPISLTSVNYTRKNGSYVKVGRTVWIALDIAASINWPNVETITQVLQINGLPFIHQQIAPPVVGSAQFQICLFYPRHWSTHWPTSQSSSDDPPPWTLGNNSSYLGSTVSRFGDTDYSYSVEDWRNAGSNSVRTFEIQLVGVYSTTQ